jgi:hypothetical protein
MLSAMSRWLATYIAMAA